ncbi:MAG: hypothetical protein AAFY20_19950 [Cyanobacteria bacterium J06639_14]
MGYTILCKVTAEIERPNLADLHLVRNLQKVGLLFIDHSAIVFLNGAFLTISDLYSRS